jgi:capsid protein
VRNNPYARRAIAKLVSASIGTGITARPPAAGGERVEALVQQADFEGQLDFYGLQTLIARTVFESGECLVRRIREGGKLRRRGAAQDPGARAGLHRLDARRAGAERQLHHRRRRDRSAGPARRLLAVGPAPRRVRHLPDELQSRRYDAAEILHFYEKERPGQLRGVPRLAVALMKLRDLDEYEEAELVRKKIEACFAAFVRHGDGSRTLAQSETTTDDAGVSTRTETCRPA